MIVCGDRCYYSPPRREFGEEYGPIRKKSLVYAQNILLDFLRNNNLKKANVGDFEFKSYLYTDCNGHKIHKLVIYSNKSSYIKYICLGIREGIFEKISCYFLDAIQANQFSCTTESKRITIVLRFLLDFMESFKNSFHVSNNIQT
jgi:hypothetical protein